MIFLKKSSINRRYKPTEEEAFTRLADEQKIRSKRVRPRKCDGAGSNNDAIKYISRLPKKVLRPRQQHMYMIYSIFIIHLPHLNKTEAFVKAFEVQLRTNLYGAFAEQFITNLNRLLH